MLPYPAPDSIWSTLAVVQRTHLFFTFDFYLISLVSPACEKKKINGYSPVKLIMVFLWCKMWEWIEFIYLYFTSDFNIFMLSQANCMYSGLIASNSVNKSSAVSFRTLNPGSLRFLQLKGVFLHHRDAFVHCAHCYFPNWATCLHYNHKQRVTQTLWGIFFSIYIHDTAGWLQRQQNTPNVFTPSSVPVTACFFLVSGWDGCAIITPSQARTCNFWQSCK